ncbi:MAG: GDSL-type esterase/lipase family protein [Clostridia bacterium]
MWYAIVAIVALGVGVGLGLGIEKLGQYMYYKRMGSGASTIELRKVYDEQSAELAAKKAVVGTVFLGDSITEQYDIEQYYPNKGYLNRGIGGNIGVQILDRMDGNVLVMQPKRIILLIGTNDLYFGFAPSKVVSTIGEIVDNIRQKSPQTQVIVEGVYPLNSTLLNDPNRNNANVLLINKGLVELCEKEKLQYVDTHKLLADSDGQLVKEYTRDGLHLNANGYVALTKFLQSEIENL